MFLDIRIAALLGAVVVTSATGGCSTGTAPSSTTTSGASAAAEPVVPKAKIEQNTGDQIKVQHPGKPVEVSCPADLPERNGASEKCLLTSGAEQYPVTVTVNGVGTPAGTSVDWQIGHLIEGS